MPIPNNIRVRGLTFWCTFPYLFLGIVGTCRLETEILRIEKASRVIGGRAHNPPIILVTALCIVIT